MSFSSLQLFLLGIGYLAILFGMAWIAERGFVPKRLLRHPITHVLSLGVYASAWAFYGSVGLAYEYGYGFLSYYRSEEHTSELQSRENLVCRLLLVKKKQ